MELVSVVIPVYNVQEYLEKCVKSVMGQTYPYWEIILVDDGSTDRSGEICDFLAEKDKRIKVIHKENGGLSDARNVGVPEATGKYLFFLDSDDTIEKDTLEKTVKIAEMYQSEIVMFDYKRVEEGEETEICNLDLKEHEIMNLKVNPELLIADPSVWTKLYLREFYLKTGLQFPKGYRYEDLGTIPKVILHARRIVYVKKAFYRYLIREGSITTGTDSERNYKHRKKMMEGVLDYFEEKGKTQCFARELEYMTFFHMYFLPAKEILYRNGNTVYIKKCRDFLKNRFPEYMENPYIKKMAKKERLQLGLINRNMFRAVQFLSWIRKQSDRIRRK